MATAEAIAKTEIEIHPNRRNICLILVGDIHLPNDSRPWTNGPVIPDGYTLTVTPEQVSGGLSVTIVDGGSGYTSAPIG
jgi:hypothetical protein